MSNSVIVEIVGRRNLDYTRTKFFIDIIVRNNRDFAVTQRQFDSLAEQMRIALIFRMHHHGDVAQHGFRAGGGNGQMFQAFDRIGFRQRIVDVPKKSIFFLLHHFEIGNSRSQLHIPVYEALTAINQAFVIQAHKGFSHGFV